MTNGMKDIVCKHFRYEYCKYKEHCPKQYVNIICPDISNCNGEFCVKMHPKTCKFFARNNMCRYVQCAYFHENHKKDPVIEHLGTQVSELKCELEIKNQIKIYQ